MNNIQLQNFNMPTDSLNLFISNVLYTPTYDAPNSVTSDLINSGNIYLISDKNLRELITEWEGNLGKLIEEEQSLVNTITNGLYPYLWSSYPIKNIVIAKFSPENKFRKNISHSLNTLEYSKTMSNKSANVEKMFTDLMFENLLSSINIGILASVNQSNDIRKLIDSVLTIIETEIEKIE